LAVKARGALRRLAFGWDQEDHLCEIAETVLRLATARSAN
jgi:hypothetical protein